ncbi:MAG: winged helix-turn-helix transcriptional regulator [Myxococcota bacterium]
MATSTAVFRIGKDSEWRSPALGRLRRFVRSTLSYALAAGAVTRLYFQRAMSQLERDGLVARKAFPVVPPKTEYRLTPLGRRLHEPVAWMCEWALGNPELLSEIHAHRRSATSP